MREYIIALEYYLKDGDLVEVNEAFESESDEDARGIFQEVMEEIMTCYSILSEVDHFKIHLIRSEETIISREG